MGLLMSVLVGCVGFYELLTCLRHISDGLTPPLGPVAPCLYYHSEISERHTSVNSMCTYSHTQTSGLPRSVRHKLENLHEYSLKVRRELRSLDKHFDESTLSDCSTNDILGDSRPDSRLSSLAEDEIRDEWNLNFGSYYGLENASYVSRNSSKGVSQFPDLIDDLSPITNDSEINSIPNHLELPSPKKYERIPTPIPFATAVDDAWRKSRSASASSSDRKDSFDYDSGNEAPTKSSFDNLSAVSQSAGSSLSDFNDIRRSISPRQSIYDVKSISEHSSDIVRTPEGTRSVNDTENFQKYSDIWTENVYDDEDYEGEDYYDNGCGYVEAENLEILHCSTVHVQETPVTLTINQTKFKPSKNSGTTILRKPTRMKSKIAEISKSAENLITKKSKRRSEPERRKSDISVQTVNFDSVCDEATNTSPPDSDLSRSVSRQSVSVEVQTSFEEHVSEDEDFENLNGVAIGLSESKRDMSFKNSFRKKQKYRRSNDSKENGTNVVWIQTVSPTLENFSKSKLEVRVSSFEEAHEGDYEGIKNVLMDSEKGEGKNNEEGSRKKIKSPASKHVSKSQSEILDDSIDEEFVDAEEGTSIEYNVPETGNDKAFWLIFSGEFTKAMNKDWHSGHFCCWQCDESLTGQRYVLRDEHPYCIKCYESVFANGCEECSKTIGIDSKDLSYKDKHWHEACFLCNKCRVSLVDKQFGSKVDKIYCGNCYDSQFASRCDGCGEIFRAGTKKMEYKTRQWHEKCFCCVVCKNAIGTKSFIPREQEIYCAGCYEDKFATRCVKCNKIITSGGVTYKNEPWHRECFTCSNCSTSLAGQRFTSRDEKPYCADCFGELFAKRCTACVKPITGIGGTRFISFEDRHWHNDCFICAGCKTSLVGRGFITDADDIICPECAKQKLM